MAFMVAAGAGYSRVLVRFPSPEEALAKARDEITNGAIDVTIVVTATGRAYTPNGFAETFIKSDPTFDRNWTGK